MLRLVIRTHQWHRMEPLLTTNLTEHEQVRALNDTVTGYSTIKADVLLLAGANSPQARTPRSLNELHRALAQSTLDILDGLDHNAPDEKAPQRVAARVLRFLQAPSRKPSAQR